MRSAGRTGTYRTHKDLQFDITSDFLEQNARPDS